jgi:glyoxylase-like metal-dependent hydrolase (beta-lactamase superfamily II)
MGRAEVHSTYDLDWREDVAGRAVGEGTRIELGGLEVRILEIPGHSSCSIAAYVPEVRTLFPSDGGGIPFEDSIIPSGNSDFTQYQRSLEKLKALDVAYLCADHYGYVTGEEASRFIASTIESAKNQRAMIEKAFRETLDVNETAARLTALFFERSPDYFLSPEIMQAVFGQMVRHIAKGVETKHSS